MTLDKPLYSRANFQPTLDSIGSNYFGYFKSVSNPSASSKRLGKYQPRLTYTQRPRGARRAAYELAIELSLPKIMYGNNFDELTDSDFEVVIDRIQESLKGMGVWLFAWQLEEAEVRAVHYSKNLIFTDYTSCSSILQILRSADIKKTYDVQNTDFRNGGYVLHVHTNSLDIAIYDKIADLQQSKVSEKRSIEKDNYTQTSIFEVLDRKKPISVMRYEIRLNGKKKIRDSLSSVNCDKPLTFKNVYSEDISKKILESHWKRFFDTIPKLNLDTNEPEKMLANILKSDDLTGPTQAAARLGLQILLGASEQRYIRTLFEGRFGKHAWARLKPLTKTADKTQYRSILAVNCMIHEFKPTRLIDIKEDILCY